MTFSNRQEIIELARSGDLTGYGVQAVVLFGSRAKGTHTDESDWDLAFLVNHPNVDRVTSLHDYWPENPFRDYDDVDACVLTSAYLKVHMYDFGQLSHQIALHGEPLLGAWTMNRELLDAMTQSRPNDWDSNLNDCYRNLNHFSTRLVILKTRKTIDRCVRSGTDWS